MQRAYRADLDAVRRHCIKPDEIGVVVSIVLFDCRQPRARNIKFEIAQTLGRVPVVDAGNAGDEVILGRTQRLDFEALLAVLRFQRAVVRDRGRILA